MPCNFLYDLGLAGQLFFFHHQGICYFPVGTDWENTARNDLYQPMNHQPNGELLVELDALHFFSKYESRPNYQNVLVGITMRTMIFLIYQTSPKVPATHFPIVHRLDGYCLIDFHIMCTATGVFSEKFTC